MMDLIYLNGRFASQPVTGVQRFAVEMTASLARLCASEAGDALIVLVPPTAMPNASLGPVRVRQVGRGHGHLWEQFELPFHAADGLLVNLANAAPLLARRQVVVLHDAGVFANGAAYSTLYRFWYRNLGRALSHSHARFVTVSAFSQGELVEYLGIAKEAIAVIYEGADHLLRVPADGSVLTRHGLLSGRYVMAVGSLVAHKNLASLVNMASALPAAGIELVLVGGMDRAVYGKDVTLPRPAKVLGRVTNSELRALYEQAACLVFPSRYEGFGLPPVEAMACGCPVVVSTAPALAESCGDAALYCDPNDRAGIAATVCRIIAEPTLAAEMRRRGRAHVRSLTWDNAARAFLRLLGPACAQANAA